MEQTSPESGDPNRRASLTGYSEARLIIVSAHRRSDRGNPKARISTAWAWVNATGSSRSVAHHGQRHRPRVFQASGEPQSVERSRVAGLSLALALEGAGPPIHRDQSAIPLAGVCPPSDKALRNHPLRVMLAQRTA